MHQARESREANEQQQLGTDGRAVRILILSRRGRWSQTKDTCGPVATISSEGLDYLPCSRHTDILHIHLELIVKIL